MWSSPQFTLVFLFFKRGLVLVEAGCVASDSQRLCGHRRSLPYFLFFKRGLVRGLGGLGGLVRGLVRGLVGIEVEVV
jgi:hypothetical protein